MDRERLRELVEIRDQLAEAGLARAYLRRADAGVLTEVSGAPAVVEPWFPGRHANFQDPVERMLAVRSVAGLHLQKVAVPHLLRSGPTLSQKLAQRLGRASRVAEQGDLPGLTRMEWRYWRERAEAALRAMPHNLTARVTESDRVRGVCCHRDLAPHNILVDKGSAQLIDFDLAGPDSPVYDLHQLFGHIQYLGVEGGSWRDSLLNAYARIAPLSDAHVRILDAALAFPSILLREIGDLRPGDRRRQGRRSAVRIRFAKAVEERRARSAGG